MAKAALHQAVREWFKENGRRAGLKGGPARMAQLSDVERSELARKGGLARQARAREARALDW